MAVLLVLRAPPDAELSAARIEKLGHVAIVAPLRHAVAVFGAPPEKPDAIIATSANGLRLGMPMPQAWCDLPFFCVGRRNAAAADTLGFSDIRVAANVEGLIRAIRSSDAARSRLLYLAGEPRRPDLEAAFPAQVAVWLRYRMADVPELHDKAVRLLREGGCDAVLHFSEQSTQLWLRLAEQAGLLAAAFSPVQACISGAVAACIRSRAEAAGQACRIVVAKQMQGESMISAALEAVPEGAGPQFD